jgi:hypothetical protein
VRLSYLYASSSLPLGPQNPPIAQTLDLPIIRIPHLTLEVYLSQDLSCKLYKLRFPHTEVSGCLPDHYSAFYQLSEWMNYRDGP